MPKAVRSPLFAVPLLFLAAAPLRAAVPKALSYEIDAAFDPPAGRIDAVARFLVDLPGAADSLVFYLHDELHVLSAAVGGSPAPTVCSWIDYPYNYTGRALRTAIPLAGLDPAEGVTVEYGGLFRPSTAKARSNYMRIDEGGVFLRAYGYSLWFPHLLEAGRDSYAADFGPVTLRTPEEYTAVFTGLRVSESSENGERVSVWSAPATDLFDAQCTARPYVRIPPGGEEGILVYSLDDSLSLAKAEEIHRFTARLDSHFRERYGGPGTEQLHVLELPKFGDIASGNMVGIQEEGWKSFEPTSWPGRTLAHELVHASVDLAVPMSDSIYAFVVEGFPSYFHLPVLGELAGGDYYERYMAGIDDGYRKRRESGTDRRGRRLPVEKPILALTADDIGAYKDRFVLADRALLFFHDLRRVLGVRGFDAFARDLFDRERLDLETFEEIVLRHRPGAKRELDLWLRTTEYPVRFR